MAQDSTARLVFIGLGSNLGDRLAMIQASVQVLRETPGVDVKRVSSIRETEPMGPVEQGPYLNAVVEIATSLPPHELLQQCLAIERNLGRDRSPQQRWGPRSIDLDILLYGDLVIDEPGLQIPHPRLHERPFVLQPLAEIAPDVIHPILCRSVESLGHELRTRSAG